jgi:dipeptidyl aminopeptidase/acylaminoacyl peptidase
MTDDFVLRLLLAACGLVAMGNAAMAGASATDTAATAGATVGAAAAEASPPVHRYLQVVISPDAAYVASVEGDSPRGGYYPELRDLVIRHVAGGHAAGGNAAAGRVGDGQEMRIALPCGRVPQCWPSSLAWSPDSKHLSFALRTPGSHAYAVYEVAPSGSGLTLRLAFGGTITALKYGRNGVLAMLATENARKEVGATEAGAAIAGDLDAAPAEQRIAMLIDGNLQWASPADLFVYEYDWRPDGAGFVGTAAPGDGDDNWWVAKLYSFSGAGEARVLYVPVDLRQQLADPVVSRDGRTVAFIGGIMSDFGSTGGDVYTLAFDTGAVIDLTPDIHASATSLGWSCQGKLRAALLVGDEEQLVEFGAAQSAAAPRVLWDGKETLDGKEAGASWGCPSDTLAAAHESFTSPPEIRVGRINHWRDLTQLNAHVSAPPLTVQSLTWRNEGFDVQGWLLLPQHPNGRIPMITIVHGGPAAASRPSFAGPGLREALLERGWAVFYPNPRGSFGQGERFTTANVRDFGYGDLRDILTGIDAAEAAAPIDEGRLGLTGGSYGGFMTMFAVTQTHRFKAAVAAAGLSNWQSYYGENGIDGWMPPYFGGSVYDDPAVYARSSAINYIKNVQTPTFAYVGERDIECPAPQTEEFWHALKAQGVPTAIMIYPGEGHGLREPQHAQDALERTLAWFDKYLK